MLPDISTVIGPDIAAAALSQLTEKQFGVILGEESKKKKEMMENKQTQNRSKRAG